MTIDPLSFFSNEISAIIFSNFTRKDLGVCCQVSRAWNEFGSSDTVWRHLAKKEFIGPIPKGIKDVFARLDPWKLRSNDEIIEKLQKFLDKVSIGVECRFKCILSGGKHLTVVIKQEGDVEEAYREDYLCESGLSDHSLKRYKTEGFSWKALSSLQSKDWNTNLEEPNYSDPVKPGVTKYKWSRGDFRWIKYEVFVPWAHPSASNRLNREIVCRVASKCNSLAEKDHIRNTAAAALAGIGQLILLSFLIHYCEITRDLE